MGKCSVPRILGLKKWFDKRFDHLCVRHDVDYKTFCLTKKLRGDFLFTYGMLMQSWKYFPLAFISLIFLLTWGTVYWLYKRTLDAIRGGL